MLRLPSSVSTRSISPVSGDTATSRTGRHTINMHYLLGTCHFSQVVFIFFTVLEPICLNSSCLVNVNGMEVN